jgi:hypothetical protein
LAQHCQALFNLFGLSSALFLRAERRRRGG